MSEFKDDTTVSSGQEAHKVSIDRRAVTVNSLSKEFNVQWQEDMSIKKKIVRAARNAATCSQDCWKAKILRFLPVIGIMRVYKWRSWLLLDLISGLSVSIVHIPQGMGFALLTEVPPVYGLYTSLFPGLIYFVFGTSRHLSMGSMALISMMIGAVVTRETASFETMTGTNSTTGLENNTFTEDTMSEQLVQRKIDIALSVSLLVGCFQFLMGLLRLGVVTRFMSMTFVSSFLVGSAFNIITGQLPQIFGLAIRFSGMFATSKTIYKIFCQITETNVCALVTGLISLAVLIVLKEVINVRFKSKMKVPIPAELLVVALGTLISHFCRLNSKYGIKILGVVNSGILPPRVPEMTQSASYVGDALTIAVISFVLSITMAKLMAKKHNYAIDINQELLAYGLCHGVGAILNCFAGAQAPPRTLVHDSIGGKSQMSSVFSSIVLLIVCLFIASLFVSLPIPVLAAVVIVSLLPLFREFKNLPNLWRTSRYDFVVWITTFLTVVILDVTTGLVVGIVLSCLSVMFHSLMASRSELRSVSGDVFVPKRRNANSTRGTFHPGVLVLRFDASLIFVNVESFKEWIYAAAINAAPDTRQTESTKIVHDEIIVTDREGHIVPQLGNEETEKRSGEMCPDIDSLDTPRRIRAVVLDFSAVSYVDIMGINALKEVRSRLMGAGTRISLACVAASMMSRLAAAGLLSLDEEEEATEAADDKFAVFPTLQDALAYEHQ